MTQHDHEDHAVTEAWREALTVGHRDALSSFLPGSPRCGVCLIPLGGVGGVLMKTLRGRSRSRKNPGMCNL